MGNVYLHLRIKKFPTTLESNNIPFLLSCFLITFFKLLLMQHIFKNVSQMSGYIKRETFKYKNKLVITSREKGYQGGKED